MIYLCSATTLIIILLINVRKINKIKIYDGQQLELVRRHDPSDVTVRSSSYIKLN